MQHFSKLMQNFCISTQNNCRHKLYKLYCVSIQIFCIRQLKFVYPFKKFEIWYKIFASIFNHVVLEFKIIVGFMCSKIKTKCQKKRFQVCHEKTQCITLKTWYFGQHSIQIDCRPALHWPVIIDRKGKQIDSDF